MRRARCVVGQASMIAAIGISWVTVLMIAGAEPASVTVHLSWPPSVSPVPVEVLLSREEEGGTPRSAAAQPLDENMAKVVIDGVSAGTYRIASREGSPYQFSGVMRVTELAKSASATLRVTEVPLVSVPFRVVLSHDGRPVEAEVAYWRQEWNKGTTVTTEGGEGTLRLLPGAKYWVEATPVKSILGKPATLGPFGSCDYGGKILVVRIPSLPPVFVCRWDVSPADSKRLASSANIVVTVSVKNAGGRREMIWRMSRS